MDTIKKGRRLSKKERTYIKEYVESGNGTQAALKAYDTDDYNTAGAISSENLKKPRIQQAIDNALINEEATPEYAVKRVKNVADQEIDNRSAPSVLKAANQILELHGWRKDERPQTKLQVNQFFTSSRNKQS